LWRYLLRCPWFETPGREGGRAPHHDESHFSRDLVRERKHRHGKRVRPVSRKEQPRVLDLDDAPRLALDPGDTVTPAW
jgi:hypothetical protein